MSTAPLPIEDLDHILAHTPDVWEEFRGGRIFMTGGTGVFGSWFLASLAHADEVLGLRVRCVVLSRDPDSFRNARPHLAASGVVSLHRGDVRTFAFPDGTFTHLIHAATTSSSHPERIGPGEMVETIVEGTRRVLSFCRHSGVRKLLFTSSGAVYGRQSPGREHQAEDDPVALDTMDPASAYGEGKRLAELLCALAHRSDGLETRVARCFTIVGPYVPLDAHFAVGNFLRDGLGGGPIRVGGDGTPYRSYLHTADLMAWLWTILARGRPGRAYNVGSDRPLTIAELAGRVARLSGTTVEIAREPVPGQPPARYVPSVGRARAELGLEVRIEIDEALGRTLAWHKKSSRPYEV